MSENINTVERSGVAVVIPTIRPEAMPAWIEAWREQLTRYRAHLVVVYDGDYPKVEIDGEIYPWLNIPKELESNHCAGVRNYGFAAVAARLPDVEYIITLDDDETPMGDTIGDHIRALNMRVPVSWMPTTLIEESTDYMRGFPYGVRQEVPAILSHGVWHGVYDYDAPTQLHADPNRQVNFYRGAIPKGALFPMCGMNLAFRRRLLPYVYFAPVGGYKGAERFDDIWAGIEIKRDMDVLDMGVVTGYARVFHNRKSNVFESLKREAVGIQKNEVYWKGERDSWYNNFIQKRAEWRKYIKSWNEPS